MATLKYIAGVDLMTVTLTSDYTAGDGHMHLTAGQGARLPAAGDFWLRTTSGTYRCFKVTARATDDLTVTAAQDGTSDGNLGAGAELKWVLGATAFDQFRADLVQTGADASKAAEKAGKLYLPNDGVQLYRDTGAVMAPWGPVFPLTPHDDSGFTWDNQGSATVSTANGGLYMYAPANSATAYHVRYKTKTGTYTITVGVLPALADANYNRFCIGWREASSGKLVTFNFMRYNAFRFGVENWNSTTSRNAIVTSQIPGWSHGAMLFMRIVVDASNRICSWSHDGVNFRQVHSIGKTDFVTPDQVVYGVGPENATYPVAATIISWKEE